MMQRFRRMKSLQEFASVPTNAHNYSNQTATSRADTHLHDPLLSRSGGVAKPHGLISD